MVGEEKQAVLYGELHEEREDIPPEGITVQVASGERKKEEASKKQAKKTLSNSEEESDAYKRQMEEQATRLPVALLQIGVLNCRAANRFHYFGGVVKIIELTYGWFFVTSIINFLAWNYWMRIAEHSSNDIEKRQKTTTLAYIALIALGAIHILALHGLYLRVRPLLLPYLIIYGSFIPIGLSSLFYGFTNLLPCAQLNPNEKETWPDKCKDLSNNNYLILAVILLPSIFAWTYFKECYVYIGRSKTRTESAYDSAQHEPK